MPQLSDKELEDRLAAAGKSLAQPPSSLDELLHLLDRAEELLSKVEQSPSKTMQTALSPLMKALVTEVLLKHSDIDVKAGVASCISEITRITAPDAPYDDDQMKDLFQLIVSSFENLSDVSSRSHEKRKTILETVAKVRSCVIMLDLECDQMIIDMFKHFLKSIRDYHDEMIFASMETIITLVLEESEDISSDLLAPILSTLKRKNQDVTPVARKLAERVIQNSTDKLRPYLRQIVTSLGTSLDDYSEVVASVCQENSDTVGHGNDSTLKDLPVLEGKCTSVSPARDPGTPVVEGKCTIASPARDPGTPVAEEDGEGTNFQDTDSTAIRSPKSPKSVVSNGIDETGTNEIPTEANTSKKDDSDSHFDATLRVESDDCDEQKPEKLEADDEQAQQEAENHDTADKDMHISPPTEIKPVETAESLDKGEDISVEVVTEAAEPVDILTAASPAQSGSHPDETLSETEIKEAREENFVDEETVSVDTAPKKAAEEETISEVKKQRRSGKKQTDDKDKASEEVASKDYDGYASDSEARSLDQVEKSRDASNKVALRKENVKKSGRGKSTVEKDTPKSSAREDHGKDIGTPRKSQLKSTKHEKVQEETPRTSNKRKLASGKEKASSEILEYGKNLVGLKVKVWWPQDRKFYEGVVESFDSGKKKHKVLYNDGDEEILNLKKERWQRLEDDVVSTGDQDVEDSSHDTSSDIRVKRKGNTSSETTSKRQKMEGSPKSKQKDTATKSSGKSKDDGKVESGSKENYQKVGKKTRDDRSKDQSQKVGGKGQADSAKASGRSKEDAAKSASHSKQDNLQTPKSKGKTASGAKPLGSGGSRTKTGTSKVKETDKMKEKTPDVAKSSETAKGKATDSAKSRESEAKGGKKRRR